MDKLPRGLNKKLMKPVPDQNATQFKVEDVIEKKQELKFDDIFDKDDRQVRETSIEDFEARKSKREKDAIAKSKSKKKTKGSKRTK